MLSIRLPEELETRLIHLSEKTGHSKAYYMRKAITKLLEDEEDYLLAVARLEENNPRISLKKVRDLLEKMDD